MNNNNNLIKEAKKAMEFAYSPYSKFKVGAALVCEDGSVFTGCNIENASYGATVCAERTAIFKAVSEGKRKIKKLAIVSSSNDLTYPCGMCRQVMSEFMEDGIIVLENKDGEIKEFKFKEMLPYTFKL